MREYIKFKKDFTVDFYTNEKIDIKKYKRYLKEISKKKNFYLTEVANFYYKKEYKKTLHDVVSELYFNELPKCPITGMVPSCKLTSEILFGVFSKDTTAKQRNIYVAENNKEYINHIEKMKIDRVGSGNPMFGKEAWNKNLSKESDERVRNVANKLVGLKPGILTKEKQSKSAKKREIHGHTGFKHTEESKQLMREKTIERFKAGKFPQTNSLPHLKIKELLNVLYNGVFEEEFPLGVFVFDFKVGNNLIEVQGDYFHCNPGTRHSVPKNNMQVKNLERDNRKSSFVKESGLYNLIEIWEYDIINNIEKVKLCLTNLKI